MKSDSAAAKKGLASALCVFVIVGVLNGLLVFVFLPQARLVKYSTAARKYLSGEMTAERRQDFSPLYLQAHILAYKISGKPEKLMAGVQVLLSAACSSLFFLLLLRFFNRPAALIGAAAFSLDRSMIVYTQVQEPEPFLMTMILAFAVLITSQPAGRIQRHLFAGIFLALSVLTRPTFLPLILVMPLYFLFHPDCRTRWRTSVAVFTLPVVLVVGGLWARNSLALGYFSPSIMNPGTVFFEGNNPSSWGFSSIYPALVDETAKLNAQESDYHHEVYRQFARKATGKDLTVPDANRYWTNLAVQYLEDHPVRAVQLYCTKAYHIFHEFLWHDIVSAFWNEQWLAAHWFPTVPFSIISALALAGLWMQARNWRTLLPLYALILVQVASMMTLYVSARQRVSVVWVFFFFAVSAVQGLAKGSRRNAVIMSIVVLPLAWMLHDQTDLMREETRLWHSIRQSNLRLAEAYRARSEDRLTDASRASAASLAAAPFYLDSRRPSNLNFPHGGFAASAAQLLRPADAPTLFDAAVLHVESGNSPEALKILEEIQATGYRFKRDHYQSSDPYYYMARAALKQKQEERAIDFLQLAEARSPGDPSVLALLSVLTGGGKHSTMLSRYFDEIDAQFYLGRAALMTNRPELAVRYMKYVTEKLPDFRRGRIYLAVSLGLSGRVEEGAAMYREAMKERSDPVMLEEESVELFRRLAEQRPQDAFALYSYGFVLRQFGQYGQALEIQRKAAALNSSDTIQKEIDALQKALRPDSERERGQSQTE